MIKRKIKMPSLMVPSAADKRKKSGINFKHISAKRYTVELEYRKDQMGIYNRRKGWKVGLVGTDD
jgi:hypothetical protein